ncbi:hypothetical protein ATE92_0089 [Ulvibacter sp. MAR_2010_11]|uniref:hypothetical protein n=1 Tax=Ulvibacter sp. MAR_2010_11 TaxID=1250229 RepID=UPI000C2B88F1|nr:hypothetical protein [Ulvibacter sp. MAR_2010_11]PKA81966.1 hypothetical protein ATE92_0089 [Ulvibacter sp. MAR_2010_11]
MNYIWKTFDKGSSIGTTGSENGVIIRDEENTFGARITLEKEGSIAPYSITIGIYGIMFHTDFYANLEQSDIAFNHFKTKIEKVIEHNSISENERNSEWNKKQNNLLDSLTD